MKTQRRSAFPRGIEVVGGVVIENDKGEILLTRSPKWSNKWVMPGGHVEPGERVVDASVREGEEETGLKLKPIAIAAWGEDINSKDFHRPAHFIYFDVHCKVVGGRINLQQEEQSSWRWIRPKDALKLDLANNYPRTIRDFIEYKKATAERDMAKLKKRKGYHEN